MKNQKVVTILAILIFAIFVYFGIIFFEKINNLMKDSDDDPNNVKNEIDKGLNCHKFEYGACAIEESESNLLLFF